MLASLDGLKVFLLAFIYSVQEERDQGGGHSNVFYIFSRRKKLFKGVIENRILDWISLLVLLYHRPHFQHELFNNFISLGLFMPLS